MVKALWKRGVQHMIWLTLHAINKQYVDTNHAIYAEQQKWGRTMTVLDWNHYWARHPSWYASDGIHMTGTGAVAFDLSPPLAEEARPDGPKPPAWIEISSRWNRGLSGRSVGRQPSLREKPCAKPSSLRSCSL